MYRNSNEGLKISRPLLTNMNFIPEQSSKNWGNADLNESNSLSQPIRRKKRQVDMLGTKYEKNNRKLATCHCSC